MKAFSNNYVSASSIEYSKLRRLNRDIRNTKNRLVNSIMKVVRPAMWESGYVHHDRHLLDGTGRPLFIFVFDIEKDTCYKLRGNVVTEFSGFTEDNAVIVDAVGGGLHSIDMLGLPVEDLIRLWCWVERNQGKFK